jgi:hypothetical protein
MWSPDIPVTDRNAQQTRAQAAVQAENPLTLANVHHSLVGALVWRGSNKLLKGALGIGNLALESLFVSTAAWVDRNINGLE